MMLSHLHVGGGVDRQTALGFGPKISPAEASRVEMKQVRTLPGASTAEFCRLHNELSAIKGLTPQRGGGGHGRPVSVLQWESGSKARRTFCVVECRCINKRLSGVGLGTGRERVRQCVRRFCPFDVPRKHNTAHQWFLAHVLGTSPRFLANTQIWNLHFLGVSLFFADVPRGLDSPPDAVEPLPREPVTCDLATRRWSAGSFNRK
ncbi:hypothetical protein SKAU_G00305040 [Synaphobranchus kaupii]|uniref:Uncharacterized protein n=1 Tax=Synaphobranchus kaupii TaxID=118154 RepID=A0A9Q1EQL8_SYNKA|nr:hypothetical protein SKAU_G00305040 [Synaphobranchus kaupii]